MNTYEKYGEATNFKALLTRDYTLVGGEYEDDRIDVLKAFYIFDGTRTAGLNRISLPSLTMLGANYGFNECKAEIDIPWENITHLFGQYMFRYTAEVTDENDFWDLSLPKLTALWDPQSTTNNAAYYIFNSCNKLRSISLPNYEGGLGYQMFAGCKNLKKAYVPKAKQSSMSFVSTAIEVLDMPCCNYIGSQSFDYMNNLKTLRLGGDIRTLGSNGFAMGYYNTSKQIEHIIMDGLTMVQTMSQSNFNNYCKGYFDAGVKFYIPRNLVEAYRVIDYWSDYADQIFAIEDHPEVIPTEV